MEIKNMDVKDIVTIIESFASANLSVLELEAEGGRFFLQKKSAKIFMGRYAGPPVNGHRAGHLPPSQGAGEEYTPMVVTGLEIDRMAAGRYGTPHMEAYQFVASQLGGGQCPQPDGEQYGAPQMSGGQYGASQMSGGQFGVPQMSGGQCGASQMSGGQFGAPQAGGGIQPGSGQSAPGTGPSPAGSIGAEKVVKSPLVGTFYESSSPEAESFVKVGDTVKKGQVLGLIEAMKLMNEIESEYDGVVEAVLVKNEEFVEYGQPLFRIK